MSGPRPAGAILEDLVPGSGDSFGFAGRCAVEGALLRRLARSWRANERRQRKITGAGSNSPKATECQKITRRRAGFYRKAAEAGHAAAQYDLAYLYENGFGVAQDWKQAAFWYRKSAEQGDAEAQNNLGALYAKGQGVPQSDAEALHWYRLAAQQEDPEGLSNLGTMYLQGRAVECDFVQAFELFLKAANLGYAVAQNNLALMYANGQAVEQGLRVGLRLARHRGRCKLPGAPN